VDDRSDGTHIVLSLQSKDAQHLEAARRALIAELPQGMTTCLLLSGHSDIALL
jgi:hypothetical protein